MSKDYFVPTSLSLVSKVWNTAPPDLNFIGNFRVWKIWQRT